MPAWMAPDRRDDGPAATPERMAGSVKTDPVVLRRCLGEPHGRSGRHALPAPPCGRAYDGPHDSIEWQLAPTTVADVLPDGLVRRR